jgi:membrane protease YdiL (CAAX protease family)
MHDENGRHDGVPPDSANPQDSFTDQIASPPVAPPRRFDWAALGRILLWVAISFFLPGPILFALRRWLPLNITEFRIGLLLPREIILFLCVLLATWIVGRLEHRKVGDYGLPLREAFKSRFWEGIFWGFAMQSVVLFLVWAIGDFHVDSLALHGQSILAFALGWGLFFIFVGLFEEFQFRGYAQFAFAKARGFWIAAVLLSLLFGAAHLGNPGENPLGIVQVVEIALVFCLALWRTGNLWFAVGMHAAWDWAETYFFGVADSGLLGVGRLLNTSFHGSKWITGGSAGPEGSVVALLVILIAGYFVHLRFPEVKYPLRYFQGSSPQ